MNDPPDMQVLHLLKEKFVHILHRIQTEEWYKILAMLSTPAQMELKGLIAPFKGEMVTCLQL